MTEVTSWQYVKLQVWTSLVRDHNADVLNTAGSAEPLVVPIIVFLTNGDRAVMQPAIDSSPTSELAVPLLTFLVAAPV